MKLITHNMLMCNKKGCTTNNFPLIVKAAQVDLYNEESQMAYSKALMQRLLEKIDYPAFYNTAISLNWDGVNKLPPIPENNMSICDDPVWVENEDFLMTLHDLCCKRHITTGSLICPSCSREFPIKNGVANMLLQEDEV